MKNDKENYKKFNSKFNQLKNDSKNFIKIYKAIVEFFTSVTWSKFKPRNNHKKNTKHITKIWTQQTLPDVFEILFSNYCMLPNTRDINFSK